MEFITLYKSETLKNVFFDIKTLTINDFWQARYINRKVLPDTYIDHNGYYPSDEDENYQEYGIITNIKPVVTDGFLSNISYYKVQDNTTGHGKPITDDKPLINKDIKAFTNYLDEITIPNENLETLTDLVNKAIKKDKFVCGFKVSTIGKSSVVFVDEKNKKSEVKIKDILLAFEVSHGYIEILDNPYFWDANKKYLDAEHKFEIMSLLSYADTSKYINIKQNKLESEKRQEKFNNEFGYCCLCYYAEKNDTNEVKKYIKHASVNIYSPDLTPALYSAVKNNNEVLVKLLIKNGSIEANKIVNGTTALRLAVENGNDVIVKTIVEGTDKNTKGLYPYQIPHKDTLATRLAIEKQRGDYVALLLENNYYDFTYKTNRIEKELATLNDEQFIKVISSGYAPIYKSVLDRIVKLNKTDAIYKMVRNTKIVSEDNLPKEIEAKHVELIEYIIDKKLNKVLDKAIENGYDLRANYSYRSYELFWGAVKTVYKAYKLDPKYVEPIISLFNTENDYRFSLTCAMHCAVAERDLKDCQTLLKEYKIKPNAYDLGIASRKKNEFAQKEPNEEIIKFVIKNCKINKQPEDRLDEKTNFDWIFQGALSETSKETCLFFFDNFKYFKYAERVEDSIEFYIGQREDEDELRIYAENKGLIGNFDDSKEPANLKEYILSKKLKFSEYLDLYKYCRDNGIRYHDFKISNSKPELSLSFSKQEKTAKDVFVINYAFTKNGDSYYLHIGCNGKNYDVPIEYDGKKQFSYDAYYTQYSHFNVPYEVVNINNQIEKEKEEYTLSMIPQEYINQAKKLGLYFRANTEYIKEAKGYTESGLIYRALQNMKITLPKDEKDIK